MPTVIDALIVTLGLDGKGFTEGSGKAKKAMKDTSGETDRMAKNMEAKGKQAALAFSKIRNEALALLAVFTAGVGIKSFAQNTIGTTAGLSRLSQNLKMSAKDLAEWKLANENAGGSQEGMAAQLQQSSNSVASAKLGLMDESTRMAFLFGINQDDLKSGETLLMAKSKIIAEAYKKDPADAQVKAGLMGISEDTFNLIKQGPQAIERLRLEQAKLAQSQADLSDKAEALRKKFNSLQNALGNVGVKILTAVMPLLNEFADWVLNHQSDIERWAGKAAVAIKDFVKWADSAAKSVGGWKNVLIALAGLKILSMITPLLSLAGALMSVGKGLGLISAGSGAVGVLASAAAIAAASGAALLLYSENLGQGEEGTLDAMRNAPTGAVRDKAIYAVEKLQRMGWDKEHAIGIVGNLQAESGMDHTAVGDGGKAYGLAQWRQDRQARFKQMFGIDIRKGTFDQQLEFLNSEMNNQEKSAGNAIRKTTNNQTAAKETMFKFERPDPKNRDRDLAIRQGNAAALYGAMEKRPNVANGAVMALNTVNYPDRGRVTPASNTSTTEVHVGKVEIHTQATDAPGIAAKLNESLNKMTLASQANTGLQ